MKKIILHTILPVAALLVTGYTQLAGAHCWNTKTLPAADVFRVRCATGDGSAEAPSLLATFRLQAQVNLETGGDGTAAKQVSLQIGGRNAGGTLNSSGIASDVSNGALISLAGTPPACTAPSLGPSVSLNNGNSDYDIVVSHPNSTVSQNYGMVYHCLDNASVHTLTLEIANTGSELAGSVGLDGMDMIMDQP